MIRHTLTLVNAPVGKQLFVTNINFVNAECYFLIRIPRRSDIAKQVFECSCTKVVYCLHSVQTAGAGGGRRRRTGTAGEATDDNRIRRMRFACRITNATNTHSEYVIIIAFPRRKWLRERAVMLRHTRKYRDCLLNIYTRWFKYDRD